MVVIEEAKAVQYSEESSGGAVQTFVHVINSIASALLPTVTLKYPDGNYLKLALDGRRRKSLFQNRHVFD